MLCVLCLIVLWGFSLVTSYSGVIDYIYIYPYTFLFGCQPTNMDFWEYTCTDHVIVKSIFYTRIGSNKGKTPEHKQAKHTHSQVIITSIRPQ